ncbi:MAG TPA: MFS transporter [bacterium]
MITSAGALAAGHSATFAALRHPNYRLFWTGMVVSLVGMWVQSTATGYLVWELTRSPLATSMTALFFGLPSMALALFGGVIADRVDRRRLLLVTQGVFMLSAIVLATLTFRELVEVWHIYLLSLVNGTVMAFDAPTRQAMIPSLVARADVPNAIALNSAAFNGSRIIGPTLGGIIYASAGPAWCFGLNAALYPAILIALYLIRPAATAVRHLGRPWHDLRDGVAYAARTHLIRGGLLMVALVGTFAFTYVVLMPVIASRVLGGGPRENGFLIASAGVGATIGALGVASVGMPRRPGRFILAFGIVASAGLVLLATSRHLFLSMALTAFTAGSIMSFLSITNSTIQTNVSDELRGRVMSLYTLALIGSGPLNALLAGTLANTVGVPLTLAVSGLLMAASVGVIASRHPALINLDTTEVTGDPVLPAASEAVLEPVGRSS